MMALEQIRREYLQGGLRREDLPTDQLALFETWQQQAITCDLPDPTAMVVATVSPEGQPSQRLVLLKQLDARGFVFFTNYGSRKAKELAGNHHVSLLFPWHGMQRQVKVGGTAEKISMAAAEASQRAAKEAAANAERTQMEASLAEETAAQQVAIFIGTFFLFILAAAFIL